MTAAPPCECPGAVRMGRSQGVVHADYMPPCAGCKRRLTYAWVMDDGRHLCGRCRFGPGDADA